jgi:hypothetical protein
MNACKYESEIKMMQKALYGNGRAGLVETTGRILERLDNMEEQSKAIRADVKVLLAFQVQEQSKQATRNTAKADKKWMFTSILALAGLIISLIKTFFM